MTSTNVLGLGWFLLGVVLLAGCGVPSTVAPDSAAGSASAGVVSAVPGARVGDDPAVPAGAFTARVERVVDGDTLIAVRHGARLRVRLIGVDAPETVRPGAPVGCWGPEASRLLTSLLPVGTVVSAAYERGHRDRYGRDLWDVWLPTGVFVQGELVRRGAAVARAYRPQTEHAGLLSALDRRATAAGRGLHGACRSPPT